MSRVHQVDAHGNLEWVERIIESKRRDFMRKGKFHFTEDEFRQVMRQAYRNGANEHGLVMRSVFDEINKLTPGEKP